MAQGGEPYTAVAVTTAALFVVVDAIAEIVASNAVVGGGGGSGGGGGGGGAHSLLSIDNVKRPLLVCDRLAAFSVSLVESGVKMGEGEGADRIRQRP